VRTLRSSAFRFVARGFAALLALGAAAGASAQTSYKQTSFHEVQVFSGLVNPTTVRFLPDGSVLVLEKSGLLKQFASLTATTPPATRPTRSAARWARSCVRCRPRWPPRPRRCAG